MAHGGPRHMPLNGLLFMTTGATRSVETPPEIGNGPVHNLVETAAVPLGSAGTNEKKRGQTLESALSKARYYL